jgi:hypothetical protein
MCSSVLFSEVAQIPVDLLRFGCVSRGQGGVHRRTAGVSGVVVRPRVRLQSPHGACPPRTWPGTPWTIWKWYSAHTRMADRWRSDAAPRSRWSWQCTAAARSDFLPQLNGTRAFRHWLLRWLLRRAQARCTRSKSAIKSSYARCAGSILSRSTEPFNGADRRHCQAFAIFSVPSRRRFLTWPSVSRRNETLPLDVGWDRPSTGRRPPRRPAWSPGQGRRRGTNSPTGRGRRETMSGGLVPGWTVSGALFLVVSNRLLYGAAGPYSMTPWMPYGRWSDGGPSLRRWLPLSRMPAPAA